jgi:hypothetical protein
MAKIYGINGIIRGKQGNNVFSVQSGTQVVKAYQPIVSNPRTIAQREQRVKFALAGKISSIVPSAALVGMASSNARGRRGAFVSQIARYATISGTMPNLQASVAYDNIVFAQGNLGVYSAVPTVSYDWAGNDPRSTLRVTIAQLTPVSPQDTPEGYGELAIACLFDDATGNLDECQVVVRNRTSTNMVYFRNRTRAGGWLAVYVVPFVPNSSTGANRAGNLNGSETDVNLSTAASAFRMGNTFGNSVLVKSSAVLVGNRESDVEPSAEDVKKKR